MTGQITTQQQLTGLATRIWPYFSRLDERERRRRLADLVGIAYAAPLAVVGVVWLVRETNPYGFMRSWPLFVALGFLLLALDQIPFFWIAEARPGRYDRFDASLAPMVTVAALLLFGPTALWVTVMAAVLALAWRLPRTAARSNRVRELRRRLLQVAALLALLGGAWVYERFGGLYPLSDLNWQIVLPALLAIATLAFGIVLVYLGFQLIATALGLNVLNRQELLALGGQLLLIIAPATFGILMSAVYVQLQVQGLVFFGAAALLGSFAGNQLGYANLDSRQRTRELEQLEQLGRAMIAAPPDTSTLPQLLAAYVPFMFQHDQIDIVVFPDQTLLHTAIRPVPNDPVMWQWLRDSAQPRAIHPNERLPWSLVPAAYGLLLAPITNAGHVDPIGGIAIALPRALNDHSREIASTLPAVQTLAAQIGSALQGAEVYEQTRTLDRLNQDLSVAAMIQSSFLPARLPERPGWQFAAQLRPARQTSGDFYDVFELPSGDLALMIADVADKGTGPALFMAVARTLIRTYAFDHPTHPDVVLWAANQRILSDSQSGLFVTLFYAVLNTDTGQLTYANAGHNPPLLVGNSGVQQLRNTGIPLGIEDSASWQAETTTVAPGDTLLLYTDGVPEAQNRAGQFFDMARLIANIERHAGQNAETVEAALIREIDAFVDGAPQADDQTLLVVIHH